LKKPRRVKNIFFDLPGTNPSSLEAGFGYLADQGLTWLNTKTQKATAG